MIGGKFGRLTVLSEATKRGKARFFLCVCHCGTQKEIGMSKLRNGHTRSCGCLQREASAAAHLTHGHARIGKRSPEHKSWCLMIARCYNENDPLHWPEYGGRGIAVCDKWRNSFAEFLADVGPKPSPRHTLDRIDVNGNYEPGNVRWATREEQSRNRRNSIRVTVAGVDMCVSEAARMNGVRPSVALKRIRNGWNPSEAVTIPHGAKRAA